MVPIEHHAPGSGAEPCLIFGIDINLPLGYHQFKFIVDGKWRHDDALPVVQDPLGNLNNWVHVPTQQQQQHLQQQQQQQQHVDGPGGGAAGVHLPLDAAGMLVHAMGATVGMQQHGGASGGAGGGDVSMDWASSPTSALPPHLALETDRMITVKRIGDFFMAHTAYELIPESGRVIVLDADLTLKQAFHALYEQRISSAPLWDNIRRQIVGMISPSDFIVLQRLFSARGAGAAELDIERQTIRGLRESAMPEGFVRPLLFCEPSDSLSSCVMTLTQGAVSAIPVLHYEGADDEEEEDEEDEDDEEAAVAAAKKPRGTHIQSPAFGATPSRTSAPGSRGSGLPVILHLATLSDIFGMLVRYFHSSMATLPLLGHPIGALGIGTWATQSIEDGGRGGIHTIGLDTPLSATLQLLITADVGALPVVDATGAVQEVYGRSDIIALALDSAYSTIDWETTSVSQALTHVHDAVARSTAAGKASGALASRSALITKAETLRGVIERLSLSVRTQLKETSPPNLFTSTCVCVCECVYSRHLRIHANWCVCAEPRSDIVCREHIFCLFLGFFFGFLFLSRVHVLLVSLYSTTLHSSFAFPGFHCRACVELSAWTPLHVTLRESSRFAMSPVSSSAWCDVHLYRFAQVLLI